MKKFSILFVVLLSACSVKKSVWTDLNGNALSEEKTSEVKQICSYQKKAREIDHIERSNAKMSKKVMDGKYGSGMNRINQASLAKLKRELNQCLKVNGAKKEKVNLAENTNTELLLFW